MKNQMARMYFTKGRHFKSHDQKECKKIKNYR